MFSLWTGQPLVFTLRIWHIVAAHADLVWFLVMMPWKFLTLRPLASCAKTFLSLHLHKTVAKLLPNPARKLACGSTQDQNNINIIILISISCQIFRDFPTYWVQSKIGFRESFFGGLGKSFAKLFFAAKNGGSYEKEFGTTTYTIFSLPNFCRGAGLRRSLTLTWIVSNRVYAWAVPRKWELS